MARPLLALVAALALTAPTRAEEGAGHAAPAGPAPADAGAHDSFSGGGMSVPRMSRLPGFAAELAQRPALLGPQAWEGDTDWSTIARSTRANRQAARWDRARGLIGQHRAAEALGVLAAMRVDDPDLKLVPAFHLAEAAAYVQLRRWDEALAALSDGELAGNAEACAWRLRALSEAQLHEQALREVSCALPAINARRSTDRDVFLRAAASAAIGAGRAPAAMQWLRPIDDRDPAANLLRGRAYVALGEYQAGRLRLERALVSGTPEQRADARLAMLEAEIGQGGLPPAQALEKLEALRFGWRGGPVEERALRLSLTLASDAHDLRATLRSGAALFRYFEPGRDAATMLARLQAALGTALAPDSPLPLAEAAGLYWDYRELAPAGVEGDRLVNRLADRLQAAGLYGRAAELLGYQLTQRAQDVAQGPLSVKVATLHLLAGRPDRALGAVRDTEQPGYSDAMRWDRKRMEAVALYQLGRPQAAVAALDGVPDAAALRAEFQWRRNAWGAYVSASASQLPAGGRLDEAGQAAVLRQAVALAMLGREADLQALRARYDAAFEGLPSAGVFDVLTRAAGSVDPAAVSEAMAKIPSASPAGQIADLIDAAPQNGG